MKCEGSESKGTRVIERKRSVTDGQTARRTRQKQYVSPRGGRHKNHLQVTFKEGMCIGKKSLINKMLQKNIPHTQTHNLLVLI